MGRAGWRSTKDHLVGIISDGKGTDSGVWESKYLGYCEVAAAPIPAGLAGLVGHTGHWGAIP